MSNYSPPFDISSAMLSLTASISEKLGELNLYHNLDAKPHLRRSNRIRSIHSSLTIEANSLTLKEVRDVIAGHEVLGPRNEIQEVKNAYAAYEEIPNIDPYSIKELKRIHGIMTGGLVEESGVFRSGDEGVFDGEKVIFIAPKPQMVPGHIRDLFSWMKREKELSPLILSSVFHYEFVFIHPFSDGNGRMARLWQTVILTRWREIFQYLPIESQIEKDQAGYYKAIADCHSAGKSNQFIEFMLRQTDNAFTDILGQASAKEGHISEYIGRLLDVMDYDVPYTANQIMAKLDIKAKENFRQNYLRPAIELGLVEMTVPDKPRSRNQRYIKK
ncbi:MAG: Fic family protein [Lachnospiraceae bacterium]|nr:Fic family protein [Lachnospiraceae bacterium]